MAVLTPTQQVIVQVAYFDDRGNSARIDGEPTWSVSDPTVAEVVVGADNPFVAVVKALGPIGVAQVVVRADADLDEGEVRELIGTLDIEVVAGEAMVATVVAGVPSEQPVVDPVVDPVVEPTV